MIDTHVHFWQFEPLRDTWINEEMEVLQRDFFPRDLERMAGKFHIDGVVAVQADQSEKETEFLCTLASQNKIIKGIVGWVDLKAVNLKEKFQQYSKISIIKGFRHILQAEEPDYMLHPKFVEGVKLLKEFNFTYDVLVQNKQLPEVIKLIEKLPDQKFIIDHCAKPAIAKRQIENWEQNLKIIAENKNVYCKISGLVTEAIWHGWNKKDFYPYLDVAVKCFGPERIVFGSDWPVIYLSASYGKWIGLMKDYMSQFNHSEQDEFFSENAKRFYDL